MKRLCTTAVTAMLLLVLLSQAALAHPGSTDADGGHLDHSTGEYHYHHGYRPHDHEDLDGDGELDCPYDFHNNESANRTRSTLSYSSSEPDWAKQEQEYQESVRKQRARAKLWENIKLFIALIPYMFLPGLMLYLFIRTKLDPPPSVQPKEPVEPPPPPKPAPLPPKPSKDSPEYRRLDERRDLLTKELIKTTNLATAAETKHRKFTDIRYNLAADYYSDELSEDEKKLVRMELDEIYLKLYDLQESIRRYKLRRQELDTEIADIIDAMSNYQ